MATSINTRQPSHSACAVRGALVVAFLLALSGCGHHASNTAAKVARHAGPSTAVSLNADANRLTSNAHTVGLADESDTDESIDSLPSGLSPIAAAVAANAPAVSTPIPSRWIEGKNYTTLAAAQPTAAAIDKVEVVEVFWYACGHCFHFDPTLEEWRKHKPAYVEFVRLPVMWGSPVHQGHARLFYTLEALGKLDELHAAVFHEIHDNGHYLVDQDPVKTEQLQRAFLKEHGVSDADFDRTYRSFSVESKMHRAEDLTKRYKVAGVPAIIVNGKYTADVGSAGGEPQLIQLINDLAASEHKR
jgi:thiol:disulfide interchange protein DsbA